VKGKKNGTAAPTVKLEDKVRSILSPEQEKHRKLEKRKNKLRSVAFSLTRYVLMEIAAICSRIWI
jgi:hypothetical protein